MDLLIMSDGAGHVKIGEVTPHGLPVVLADIRFQLGDEAEVGVNGVRVEDLLEVCLARLRRDGDGTAAALVKAALDELRPGKPDAPGRRRKARLA